MSGGVSGADCRRNTEDLVDRWAHDAKIVKDDEHVRARAGLESHDHAWKNRNEVTPGHAGRHLAVDVAKELAPEIAQMAAEHVAIRGAMMAAGGVVVGGMILTAYDLMKHGWAVPNAKGDHFAALAHNDAVNVAIAKGLAFDPRFGEHEAAARPGVLVNAGKLLEALQGKDRALTPILQARADEGFVATERAFAATKHLAGHPDRHFAMAKWLDDNGYGDRRRNDVAFGKGMEYFNWVQSARGVDPASESKKVHDRAPVEPDFACRG